MNGVSVRRGIISLTVSAILAFSLVGVMPASGWAANNETPMYRMYNPNSGEHFYTAAVAECEMLVDHGWAYEGVGWVAPATSSAPVYRLYSGTDHHYTTSLGERNALIGLGWKAEGIGWYSDTSKTVPLYRQYNPNVNPAAPRNNSGSHNYTTLLAENNMLVNAGWRAEGIGWYGTGAGYQTEIPSIVYVTPTGKSYHRMNCATTKNSTKTAISLAKAQKSYSACKVCFH